MLEKQITSTAPTVYAGFALRKIEDQCPGALCIHLFSQLLSHSSINELLAFHPLREWLFFGAVSLLYFTDIPIVVNCQFTSESEGSAESKFIDFLFFFHYELFL